MELCHRLVFGKPKLTPIEARADEKNGQSDLDSFKYDS